MAVYKTWNTGTGNGMRETWGMGKMLHSKICCQTLPGMSSNILGNVTKHSRECPETLQGMSPNTLLNVPKHSGECGQTFPGMLSNIPGYLTKHSKKCPQTFRGVSPNILGNVTKHFREWPKTLQGLPPNTLHAKWRHQIFYSKLSWKDQYPPAYICEIWHYNRAETDLINCVIVAKHSGKCVQTFRGLSSNIPQIVLKHSRECPETFWGMSPYIALLQGSEMPAGLHCSNLLLRI